MGVLISSTDELWQGMGAAMAAWQFRTLNPNENSGSSISDENFSIEERTKVQILVRETLQNPRDRKVPRQPDTR